MSLSGAVQGKTIESGLLRPGAYRLGMMVEMLECWIWTRSAEVCRGAEMCLVWLL